MAAVSASAATPARVRPAGHAWLWSNVLLTCGAIGAAVGLAPDAGAPPVRALSWLLFTGSSVHVASTGWLFTRPDVRAYAREHTARCLWVPIGLIAAAAAAASAISPDAFQWLLLPFFCWQFFHYCKQNVGMAALAASAQRLPSLTRAERWPLLGTGVAAVAALAARPGLLGLHLAPAFAALAPAATAAFLLAVATGMAALARRPASDRTRGFCVTYLTSLLFPLPAFVFGSPYAAVGGMTVAHGLQYLLLVALIAGKTGSGVPATAVSLTILANIALIGGAALSAGSHLHNAGPAGRVIFGCYLGAVMGHFVIDAGLWRMRDPLARKFMTASLPFLVPGIASTDPSSADIGCTA